MKGAQSTEPASTHRTTSHPVGSLGFNHIFFETIQYIPCTHRPEPAARRITKLSSIPPPSSPRSICSPQPTLPALLQSRRSRSGWSDMCIRCSRRQIPFFRVSHHLRSPVWVDRATAARNREFRHRDVQFSCLNEWRGVGGFSSIFAYTADLSVTFENDFRGAYQCKENAVLRLHCA